MNWEVRSLGELISYRNEFIQIDDTTEYKRVRVQLHAKGIVLRDVVKGLELKTKNQQVCKKGDFLVAEIDAKVGGFGIVPEELEGAIVSSHYFLFDIDESKLDRKFLGFFLKTPEFQNQIVARGTTNYAAIRPQHVLEINIPLPTIEEQRRIVSILENISDGVEEAKALQEEQSQLLSKLRQAILQEAVQGKLVPQDPADEPAAKLLKRIKAKKEQLIKEKKIRKEEPLPPISENEILYKLPEGWVWCRLREIGQINPRNQAPDNIDASFIPMSLISEKYGVIPGCEKRNWGDIKKGFTHFQENDVVLAKITPCFENSKAGIVKGLFNRIGAGTTELHVFRGNNEFILPELVYNYFKSPQFLREGQRKMTGTAGQKRVPAEFVTHNPFPLPPLNEQKRIVAKANELMKLCDELEEQIRQSKRESERLMQAVLREVFEGKYSEESDQEVSAA